jgi:hypothetical protein
LRELELHAGVLGDVHDVARLDARTGCQPIPGERTEHPCIAIGQCVDPVLGGMRGRAGQREPQRHAGAKHLHRRARRWGPGRY